MLNWGLIRFEPIEPADSVADIRERMRVRQKIVEHWRDAESGKTQGHDADGHFESGSGSGGGGALYQPPAAPVKETSPEKKTGKVSLTDFQKDKIALGRFADRKPNADKFIEEWDQRVGEAPADFKREFLGGVDATMRIDTNVVNSDDWVITGSFQDKNGREIGTYTRQIDWKNKRAVSAYLKINDGERDHGIGKKVLAGNVAMYQKMGIERVDVHANIDIGGYAWARYGYVPTTRSWSVLSAAISRKLNGAPRGSSSSSSSGNTYTPDDWDQVSEDDRDAILAHWREDTRDEYMQSEIESWRDNGNALDDAKYVIANHFTGTDDWAHDAVQEYLDEHKDVPYTAAQILNSISAEEYQTGYEGRKDIEFVFNDSRLREPNDAPPPEQKTLPGIEVPDYSTHLTQEMRDGINEVLVEASNKEAQTQAENTDPPEYLFDEIEQYQDEHWESKSDREKFRWAESNGYLPEIPIESEDDESDAEPVAVDGVDKTDLGKLAKSYDPKALWAIADSDQGKRLLLHSDWNGILDLKDPETMTRFNAYVGNKAKNEKAKAA